MTICPSVKPFVKPAVMTRKMTIIYETKGGKQYGQSYDYFGLPNLLETLDKWDEEHS